MAGIPAAEFWTDIYVQNISVMVSWSGYKKNIQTSISVWIRCKILLLKLPFAKSMEIKLFSATGQCVKLWQQNNQVSIQCCESSEGFYFVQLIWMIGTKTFPLQNSQINFVENLYHPLLGKYGKNKLKRRWKMLLSKPRPAVHNISFCLTMSWKENGMRIFFHNSAPIVLELGCGRGVYGKSCWNFRRKILSE